MYFKKNVIVKICILKKNVIVIKSKTYLENDSKKKISKIQNIIKNQERLIELIEIQNGILIQILKCEN